MNILGKEIVKLEAYLFRGGYFCYEAWIKSRGVGALSSSWEEFKISFLNHYIPFNIRKAHAYSS